MFLCYSDVTKSDSSKFTKSRYHSCIVFSKASWFIGQAYQSLRFSFNCERCKQNIVKGNMCHLSFYHILISKFVAFRGYIPCTPEKIIKYSNNQVFNCHRAQAKPACGRNQTDRTRSDGQCRNRSRKPWNQVFQMPRDNKQ